MELSPVGISIAAAALLLALLGRRVAPIVAIVCFVFVSSAIVALNVIGGAPITVPQWGLVILIACAALQARAGKHLAGALHAEPALQVLFLFVMYAVASAVLFPRLFAGETLVFTLSRGMAQSNRIPIPLRPSSGNITQAFYLVGGAAAFCAVQILVRDRSDFRRLATGFGLLIALHVSFGIVDAIGKYGMNLDVLSFLRSAKYAMLTDDSVLGFFRLVGTYPEASGFAFASAGYIAFALTLWLYGRGRTVWPLLSLALIILLGLSTSSTGYVFLTIAVLAIGGFVLGQVARNRFFASTLVLVAFVGILATVGLVVLVVNETAFDSFAALIDRMVFNKLGSQSAAERFMWNRQNMANFTDTFGVGVGLGSSRSSSWLLALVSQVGVIGSALFGLFLFLVLATPRPRQVDSGEQDVGVMQLAFKAYMAGILVASAISGAVFDLGLAFYLSAGMVVAARRVGAEATAFMGQLAFARPVRAG